MTQTLLRLSVEEIMPFIGLKQIPKLFETPYGAFKVRMSSARLECFKRNHVCVVCRRAGNLFLLQRHVNNPPKVGMNCNIQECMWCWGRMMREGHTDNPTPHLNLFNCSPTGALILMTQDHIIPKSRGGGNTQSNLQTMCQPCNCKKGNSIV